MENISALIKKEVDGWINESDEIENAKDINSGLCGDFADYIVGKYGKEYGLSFTDSYDIYDYDTHDIQDASPKYDNLDRNSELFKDLIALAEKSEAYKAGHIFIYCESNKSFYDSECPEGVLDPLKLPIFKRFVSEMEEILQGG